MSENVSHIEAQLLSARRKFMPEAEILAAVAQLLNENETERDNIRAALRSQDGETNPFKPALLEKDSIFHLTQIKAICIDYRLRFLDSSLFSDGIPEEAISKIGALEKTHGICLQGFKIMAPTKAFQLLSYDDPLLFAPIANDYYYLVHKWGNDITPKRKWLVKPFKNLMNFTWFCVVLSLLITWMTPQTNLSKSVPMANIIIFLFAFKSIIAVFLYAFFMLGKNFNAAIWDRKYFNN